VKCLPGVRSGGRLAKPHPPHRLTLPVGWPTSKRIAIKECSHAELLDDPLVGLVTMSDGVDRQTLEHRARNGRSTASYRSLPTLTSLTSSGPTTRRLLRGAGQRCQRQSDRRGAVWADQDRQREEVIMPDRDNTGIWERDDRLPTHGRVREFLESLAKRRILINLPRAGERSSDLATPFHPSGDGSPGASDGGGRGSGPPIHRRARHQQGARRPAVARVLRLRSTSRPVRGRSARSGRKDISRRRAERRLRSLGRVVRQPKRRTSCSSKLVRALSEAADCPDPHQSQRPQSMSEAAAIRSSETTTASPKSASG